MPVDRASPYLRSGVRDYLKAYSIGLIDRASQETNYASATTVNQLILSREKESLFFVRTIRNTHVYSVGRGQRSVC